MPRRIGWALCAKFGLLSVLTLSSLPARALTAQQAAPAVPDRAIPDPVNGSAELAELRAMLESWAALSGWPHLRRSSDSHPLSEGLEGDPCPAISSRLALFRTRFGLDYGDCPGWSALSESAARAYDRLTARFPAHEPYPGSDRYADQWYAAAWTAVKALLLDVAGRGEEARTILLGDSARVWAGCCWPCLSEDLFYLTRARAEFLDRAGDVRAALRWYHEAYYRCEGDEYADLFGRSRPARDLMLARYAILLAEAGEKPAAASVVRRLAQAPESLGQSIIRDGWRDRLSGEPDSPVTVFTIPLRDGSGSDGYGSGTAFVIGDPELAQSWRLVAVSLPQHPERSAGRRISPNCGEDFIVVDPDDARVRPFIQACVDQTSASRWADGVLALHALDGSGRDHLVRCLEWLDVDDESWGSRAAIVDRSARLLCGDGPDIEADTMTLREIRTAWLGWLR